jgi:RimJ/RimL family protein N-acetyltransferase
MVEAHATAMFAVLTDPAIYEFEGEPPPSLERLKNGILRRESRVTPDGQTILDWAVRLPTGEISGFVQATLYPDGAAYISYEFASRFWRRGIGSAAVQCMLDELTASYAIHTFVAVLKAENFRSKGLLEKLGFEAGTAGQAEFYEALPDEITLVKQSSPERGRSTA